MSKNRYGRIHHSNHHHINLRFPSADARDEFAVKFQKYHDGHDHDGEAPRFEEIKASEAGSTTYESGKLHDAHGVTIDGYASYEIEEYHEDKKHTYYYRYKPPTCCVAPLISIKRKIVRSDTLERHELSAIFGDMPDEDYQSLLASVEKDGFIDNVIRMRGPEVLDGWHRYRAAKELNLLRKLRFKQWDERYDGDPAAFVLARNIERRHLDPSKRAQIVVAFNERFGHGTNRYTLESPNGDSKTSDEGSPNGEPKTRQELATEAGVSTRTIDRAIAVEKEGKSQEVISGETTAGEVIKARDAATAKKRKKQVLKNIWDKRKQAGTDYLGDGDTDLNQSLSLDDLRKGFADRYDSYAEAFESGMQRIDEARAFQDFVDSAFEVDEHGIAKVNISDLEAELKAISAYAYDILIWQREDWSPDTNWILPLIEESKRKKQAKPSKPVTAEEAKQMEKDYPQSLDAAVGPKPDDEPKVTAQEQELAEDQERAKQAERQMWDALESVAPDWAKDDFAAAACDRMNWGVTEFPDLLETDIPAVWKRRFELLRNEITLPADWIQQMLTKMAETEPESSPDPDVETELRRAQERANTSRRRMWSQVSSEIRTKAGKTLQDLSNEDIAKAAADALGLSRIEVPGRGIAFEAYEFIMGDIESPPYSLSDCTLNDARTWTARFYKIYDDIENRAEWVSELLADAETLRQQIEKNVRAVRDAYTEIYKKGAASVSAMFTAGITYYNLPKEGLELSLDNPTGGYTDEKRLTRIEGVTAQMLRDFEGRVKAVWIRKSLSNDVDAENLPLQNALDDMKARASKPDGEPAEETVASLWAKIEPLISEWKSNRKDQGVGRASKTMLLSAAKRFLDIPKDAETDVELLKKLLDILAETHGPSYTFTRYVKMQCDGASIWEEPEPDEEEETDELDEDTSLTEIDNLPAVKYFLETLLKQVDTFTHQVDKDNFSCAIYDLFLSDGDVYLTERQQLAILIDVAHTLVSESESL